MVDEKGDMNGGKCMVAWSDSDRVSCIPANC